MGRPRNYENEELIELLAHIENEYGFIDIANMKKAHQDDPYRFPSYKMFERRFGGMIVISHPDFRMKLKPYLAIEKAQQK